MLPSSIWTVEHDDGTVHAIDTNDVEPGVQPWRNMPVCGTANSDRVLAVVRGNSAGDRRHSA